ncbi:MAG TPA: cation:proton antiporter [Kiritimatiellia bacterium]|nr:cation:proton antiporter [Kiritimatiellia bacterium]
MKGRSPILFRALIAGVVLLAATTAWASGGGEGDGSAHFIFQMALILSFAHLGGALARRLRLPSVVGELSAGLLIGPYALGGWSLPLMGVPFPVDMSHAGMPLPAEILHLSTLAAVLLLFVSGLETDVGMFLRYSGPGFAVGVAGVIFAYAFGAGGALMLGLADSWLDPIALFFGAVSTATSVGITARLLSEKRKMESPEGVTILAAAVLDDILCFVLLAVVVGIVQAQMQGAEFAWGAIGLVAARTVGFWILLAGGGLLLGRRVARLLKALGSHETIGFVTFGLALLLAGVSERAGLAAIIGAYTTGLALSRSDLADVIREKLHGLYSALVPVFFCVSGMLVDVASLQGAVGAGLIFTLMAVFSKVGGCGLAAFLSGFNGTGSLRIGLGMLPRGEVALIVAGLGMAQGVLTPQLYGVAVMMAILTTLVAPPLLNPLLTERPGLRKGRRGAAQKLESVTLDLPREDVVELLLERIVSALRREEYLVQPLPGEHMFRARQDAHVLTLSRDGTCLKILAPPDQAGFVRYLVLEELIELEDMIEECRQKGHLSAVHEDLIRDAFTPVPAAEPEA